MAAPTLVKQAQALLLATSGACTSSTFARDLNSAWEHIEDPTVDLVAQQWAWRLWAVYCFENGYPDPFLAKCNPTE
jgi:hypothetical protein